jgi:flagellar motor switch/type III secretory pathway protein FliN
MRTRIWMWMWVWISRKAKNKPRKTARHQGRHQVRHQAGNAQTVRQQQQQQQKQQQKQQQQKQEKGDKGTTRRQEVQHPPQDHAHIFKLGRLHYEVERRQLALEELAALKSQRDAIAADVARRHTIVNEIVAEVGRLKLQVEKKLGAFQNGVLEGGGHGSGLKLNVHAAEFRVPT